MVTAYTGPEEGGDQRNTRKKKGESKYQGSKRRGKIQTIGGKGETFQAHTSGGEKRLIGVQMEGFLKNAVEGKAEGIREGELHYSQRNPGGGKKRKSPK